MEEEKWIPVNGFEGRYEISNNGNVKSLKRQVLAYGVPIDIGGILLKKVVVRGGYHRVTLCKEGKTFLLSVHRIVAINFIPNPENKATVNHKNGIKTDNRVENLEWCTVSENNKHSYDFLGKITPNKGITKPHKGSTPVYQLDLSTNEIIDKFDSAIQASQKFGDYSYNGARKIARVCRKQRGRELFGYTWVFQKDYRITNDQKERALY